MSTTAIKAPRNMEAMTPAPAQAPAKKPQTALDYLHTDAFKTQVAAALPKFFDKDRFLRAAINEFRLNPALAECTVPSVLGFFMQAAMCGLEPSSVLGQCYPVPFNNRKTGARECQYIIGYRGMASIARRSGEVLSIDAQVVHERDEFELEYGLDQKLVHIPYIDGDPGPARGAYCIVRFKDGGYQYRYMPMSEIEAHRKRSKAKDNGPWKTDYEEMMKKTVFRGLFKWLPITIEQAQQLSKDGTAANLDTTVEDPEEALEVDFKIATDDAEGVPEGDAEE